MTCEDDHMLHADDCPMEPTADECNTNAVIRTPFGDTTGRHGSVTCDDWRMTGTPTLGDVEAAFVEYTQRLNACGSAVESLLAEALTDVEWRREAARRRCVFRSVVAASLGCGGVAVALLVGMPVVLAVLLASAGASVAAGAVLSGLAR